VKAKEALAETGEQKEKDIVKERKKEKEREREKFHIFSGNCL